MNLEFNKSLKEYGITKEVQNDKNRLWEDDFFGINQINK